jgi:hypothetical protein
MLHTHYVSECDFSLVNDMSKLAQLRVSVRDDAPYRQDELALSKKSLECLGRIMQSLVMWCKNIMPRPFFADEHDEFAEEIENIAPSGTVYRPVTDMNEVLLTKLDIDDDPDQFLEKMHFKKALERGIALFNLHPEKVKKKKVLPYI